MPDSSCPPRWTSLITSWLMVSPLRHTWAINRGASENFPSPTSELLTRNPANMIGSVPGS